MLYGRNEEKLKKQRSTTAFKASLFFFPMLCTAVLFCFPFSAGAELITPLPYELATTTAWANQAVDYGNAIIGLDLGLFTVDEEVSGFDVIMPLRNRSNMWIYDGAPGAVLVGELGYYDGSDHFLAYTAPVAIENHSNDIFLHTFSFPTSTLITERNYYVRIYYTSGGGTPDDLSYVQMAMISYNGIQPAGTAVRFEASSGGAPPEVNFSWDFPYGGYIVPNYNMGTFSWENVPTSSYIGFDFFIEISTSSDFSDPFVSELGLTPPATPAQFGEAGSGSGVWSANTFQQNLSTTTEVFGRAFLRGVNISSTTILATATTTWSFIAQTEYGGGYSTTTDVCSPDLNFIVFGLCRLFMPDMGQLYQYQALKTDLENKPPFGYFNSFSDALSGVATSTTSTIPFPDLSLLGSFFTGVKSSITFLLWFTFGFWGFHKFRNITL